MSKSKQWKSYNRVKPPKVVGHTYTYKKIVNDNVYLIGGFTYNKECNRFELIEFQKNKSFDSFVLRNCRDFLWM